MPDRAGPEPRWPALVAVLAVGGLYAALPASLAVGPRWLELMIVCVLLVPTMISHRAGRHRTNNVLGQLITAVMTVFMIWSLVLLVIALPAHKEPPVTLLRSAAALWVTNVLVFALWYWRLDGGGPHLRYSTHGKDACAFLFPQIALQQSDPRPDPDDQPWTPMFIDYLFLAFNTSTAFSPTDTPVLSRWAKVLTMIQASISLAVIAILAARAVNIL
ncbi:MAG TPA: hypothetical protein VN541_23305 [Tepidisphaeraceae bacterium]|nr:hypothetical protein [Tepidisphaeraceae bacterium]